MNKVTLVAKIAEKSGLSKKQAELALGAFIDSVTEALKAGDKVQLMGFGTFEVKERAARTGRNPSTGATIEIPASKTPRSRPARACATNSDPFREGSSPKRDATFAAALRAWETTCRVALGRQPCFYRRAL